ncbi:hypothetical protein OHS58_48515 [Amycolatopsis sp. NBC_00348]|uniref:hypothetical protein n=1 Tax=unclassified Amycolatopsis TaxID=2618356 RepID=UPI002E26004B|nr:MULTISPECIES: hypothetical protein [unclassified Amycolatopsis]
MTDDNRTPAETMDDWADRAAEMATEFPHAAGHYRTVSRYWREGAAQAREVQP